MMNPQNQHQENAPSDDEPGNPVGASSRALHLLIVDDDELIHFSMESILDILGHTLSAAFTGEECLAQIKQGLKPDVVILDMNMPGIGGAKTLPLLRELLPSTPILLATGRTDQTAAELADTYPGVTLLSKPVSLLELEGRLLAMGR